MNQENIKKSSIYNIDANVIVLIGYIGGLLLSASIFAWALPFIIYLLEKKNEFIKKQMVQATTLYLVSTIFLLILRVVSVSSLPLYAFEQRFNFPIVSLFITGLLTLMASIIGIITIAFSIIATVKTWKYEDYEMPIISKLTPYVKKLISKLNSEATNNNKSSNEKDKPKQKEKDSTKSKSSKQSKEETNYNKKQVQPRKRKSKEQTTKKMKGDNQNEQ